MFAHYNHELSNKCHIVMNTYKAKGDTGQIYISFTVFLCVAYYGTSYLLVHLFFIPQCSFRFTQAIKTIRKSSKKKKKKLNLVMMEQYNNVTVYTFSPAQLTYIVLIGMVSLFIDYDEFLYLSSHFRLTVI